MEPSTSAVAETDGGLLMSRKTEWIELAEGQYRGLGQRVLATSGAELGLLELREITLDTEAPAEEAPAEGSPDGDAADGEAPAADAPTP
jgi:hypothetical protein